MKILLRLLERIARIKVHGRERPFAIFFLLVGVPSYGLFAALLIKHRAILSINVIEFAFFFLALSWIWISPLLIWYYYSPLLGGFRRNVAKIMINAPHNLETVAVSEARADGLILVWTLLVVRGYLVDFPYVQLALGIEPGHLSYYVALAGVVLQACLTGVGFVIIWNTAVLVKRICRQCDFTIHPYDVDDIAGLSAFGRLTIRTTLIFSSGAFYVPIVLTSMKAIGGAASKYVYALIIVFTGVILLSSSYPNYVVHRRMETIAGRDFEKLSRSLCGLSERILSGSAGKEDLATYNATRAYYLDYKSVHLYPFNLRAILVWVPSVLFPLLMTLLQIFLPRIM